MTSQALQSIVSSNADPRVDTIVNTLANFTKYARLMKNADPSESTTDHLRQCRMHIRRKPQLAGDMWPAVENDVLQEPPSKGSAQTRGSANINNSDFYGDCLRWLTNSDRLLHIMFLNVGGISANSGHKVKDIPTFPTSNTGSVLINDI